MIQKTLKNKVTLFYEKMPHLHSVSIDLFVKSASRYENKKYCGASYLINRLIYKKANCEQNQNLGNVFNAVTYKEFAHFNLKSAPNCFKKSIDAFYDALTDNEQLKKDFECEKKLALDNIISNESDLLNCFEKFEFLNNSLSIPYFGEYNSLKNVELNELLQFKDEHYTGENMFLIISGNITDDDISYVQSVFSDGFFTKCRETKTGKTTIQTGRCKTIFDEDDYIDVKMAFSDNSGNISKENALVLSSIIGGGDNSYIKKNFKKQKIDADVYSEVNTYSDILILNLSCSVENKNVKKAISSIFDSLKQIKNNVGDKEISLNIEFFINELIYLKDNPQKFNEEFFWEYITSKNIFDIDKKIKKYRLVNAESLRKCADEIFDEKNLNVMIFGNCNSFGNNDLQEKAKTL